MLVAALLQYSLCRLVHAICAAPVTGLHLLQPHAHAELLCLLLAALTCFAALPASAGHCSSGLCVTGAVLLQCICMG